MTEQDLAEAERLASKATPGEWRSTWDDITPDDHEHQAIVTTAANVSFGGMVIGMLWFNGVNVACRHEDAEFIAAARTLVPALVAAVRERDAEVARLRVALTDIVGAAWDNEELKERGRLIARAALEGTSHE